MRPIVILAALAASPALAQTMPPPPPEGAMLEVMAEGRTTRVPDVATIRAGVVTQAATAGQAMTDNAQRMTRVVAALRHAGVADRDIRTATVGLAPQYRYADNQPPVLTGYQATNSVAVRFRDIARAGAILDGLVAAGANQIDGPELGIDQPDAALDEARTDAVARAKARAQLYARAAGLQVVRIVSISEGSQDAGGPVRPMLYARAAADSASTPIAPGERDVTVSLTIRFQLK